MGEAIAISDASPGASKVDADTDPASLHAPGHARCFLKDAKTGSTLSVTDTRTAMSRAEAS